MKYNLNNIDESLDQTIEEMWIEFLAKQTKEEQELSKQVQECYS